MFRYKAGERKKNEMSLLIAIFFFILKILKGLWPVALIIRVSSPHLHPHFWFLLPLLSLSPYFFIVLYLDAILSFLTAKSHIQEKNLWFGFGTWECFHHSLINFMPAYHPVIVQIMNKNNCDVLEYIGGTNTVLCPIIPVICV